MNSESMEYAIVEMRRKMGVLEAGIAAVRDLINESTGVAGLHRNGDVAAWSDLEEGGWFEAWLGAFSRADAERAENMTPDKRRTQCLDGTNGHDSREAAIKEWIEEGGDR